VAPIAAPIIGDTDAMPDPIILPVFSRDGTPPHYFGNQRDITHRSSDGEAGDHHVLGKADLAAPAEAEFHALRLGLPNTQPDPARHLETRVEAGRVPAQPWVKSSENNFVAQLRDGKIGSVVA